MTQHTTRPPDNDRDFYQLTGAFDQPIAPSPAFAERLKQQVAETRSEKGASTMQEAHTAHSNVSSMTTDAVIAMPDRGRTGIRVLEAVAAAILILALIGGGFFLNNRNGNSPDNNRIRLAAVTGTNTPESAATPSTTASGWTDPGHTNAFPAGFDLQTAQPAEPLGGLDFNSDFGLVVENTLILAGEPSNINPESPPSGINFVAVDLSSGLKLWTANRLVTRLPVASDDALLGIEITDELNGKRNLQLFALSAGTGETLWTQPVFSLSVDIGLEVVSPLQQPLSPPIVIDGTVYIAKASGDVAAFDAATGSEIWQTDSWDDERNPEHVGGSLVGDSEHLYVVNGENAIRKLDRQTGKFVNTLVVNYRPASNYSLNLALQGDRLVMVARDLEMESSDALIDVLSADTGTPLWSTVLRANNQYGQSPGSFAITSDVLAIPEYVTDDATPDMNVDAIGIQMHLFDLETGEDLGGMDASLWQGASASASGSVVCIHDSTPQISCDDIADREFTPQTIDIMTGYEAEGPPSPIIFLHDSAIVLGHDGGPHIIRSGNDATPETATPVASPAASPENAISDFKLDYQSTGQFTVNLRDGPGIRYDVVATVSPETPLQALGGSEQTRHPEEDGLTDGQEWIKVRTRNGEEGWIRAVDITARTP